MSLQIIGPDAKYEISSHRYNNITEVRNINVGLTLMSRKNNRDGRARGRHVADSAAPSLAQKNNNIFVLIDIFHPPSMKRGFKP